MRKLRSSEKVEILQIGLILRVNIMSIMRKHYFLLWMKKTAFSPYFYHGTIFCSAELFHCAANFKFYLNFFIFLNIITNQTSKEQYLNYETVKGSTIQRGFGRKVSGLQFHRGFILYECFWGFWSHFSEPVFCRSSHNLICNKLAILKNKILLKF